MALIPILKKSPLQVFSKTVAHIALLARIEADLREHTVRKLETKASLLHRAHVVFLAAGWQAFIESLATEAYQTFSASHTADKSSDRRRKSFDAAINCFNTPSSKKINDLFREAAEIQNVSHCWTWDGMTTELAALSLHEFLARRHEVAHTLYSTQPLSREGNIDYMKFLFNAATLLQNLVAERLGIYGQEQLPYPELRRNA